MECTGLAPENVPRRSQSQRSKSKRSSYLAIMTKVGLSVVKVVQEVERVVTEEVS